jgi:hypothetical protein
VIVTILMMAVAQPAHSATCDVPLKAANNAPKEKLATAYRDLAKCDPALAEKTFPSLITKADDSDSLSELFLAAVDTDAWNAVWSTISKISDYTARDVVAEDIGAKCVDNPKVVQFLQGGYFALKDVDFKQWDDAFIACESPKLDEWIVKQVDSPPKARFDEKYDTLLQVFAKKQKANALPHMASAAIKASEDGPFEGILVQMDAAVAPEIGDPTPEDQKLLTDAYMTVAKGVSHEKARAVADRLVNAGDEARAIEVLKLIYADRMEGGNFIYGAASVEAGECKGTKTAILHWAQVTEPAKRWEIREDVTPLMRALEPKLKKCTEEEGAWPVLVSTEPLQGSTGLSEWVFAQERDWKAKGYTVTVRSEPGLVLP